MAVQRSESVFQHARAGCYAERQIRIISCSIMLSASLAIAYGCDTIILCRQGTHQVFVWTYLWFALNGCHNIGSELLSKMVVLVQRNLGNRPCHNSRQSCHARTRRPDVYV